MDFKNSSIFHHFILLGLSTDPTTQAILFSSFLMVYMITLTGNVLLIVSVIVDRRLHNSMYFFLSKLSFLDILNSSVIIPNMLMNCVISRRIVSYVDCLLQVYFFLLLAQTECVLLAFMAYDRYVAICNPLRYNVVMDPVSCVRMISVSWISGSITSSIDIFFMHRLKFCRDTTIDHFFCEAPSLLQLACSDISENNIVMLVGSAILLLVPLSLILYSYVQIFMVILKIQSGRSKAFSTCISHLIVVIIFYGTGIFMYMQPRYRTSQVSDKMVSVFYTIITPMLNPMIYSLRNKDVHRALRHMRRLNNYISHNAAVRESIVWDLVPGLGGPSSPDTCTIQHLPADSGDPHIPRSPAHPPPCDEVLHWPVMMAGASHFIIHDDNSSDSDVCWLGPEDLEYKAGDGWDVYSHERSFQRSFSSDEEVTCIDLYEDVPPIDPKTKSQTKPNLRNVVSNRARRAYKPRDRVQSSDRSSPEKSIARERSTIDSAGNITLMTETIYKCNKCDKTFYTRSGYRKHQRNHSEDSGLTCGECGETCQDLTAYNLHKEAHVERRPWSCTVCHKRFRLQSHLTRHERTHTGERPYSCTVCGNTFSQSSNLATHMKTHKGEAAFACSECGKSFTHKSELEVHRTAHAEEKVQACPPNGKIFQRSFHQTEEPYTCSRCGQCFGIGSDLIAHQRVHDGDKPFACVICGKKFCNEATCAKHQKGHSGSKTFLCGGCGKNFRSRATYTSHSCVLVN